MIVKSSMLIVRQQHRSLLPHWRRSQRLVHILHQQLSSRNRVHRVLIVRQNVRNAKVVRRQERQRRQITRRSPLIELLHQMETTPELRLTRILEEQRIRHLAKVRIPTIPRLIQQLIQRLLRITHDDIHDRITTITMTRSTMQIQTIHVRRARN